MRRPLINVSQKSDIKLSAEIQNRTTVQTGPALEKVLRQRRTKTYIETFTKLDAGEKTCHQHNIDQLIDMIRSEFPDLEPYQFPLGIIARCYLGNPYEVHTLDITLEIIQHYKKGEVLPQLMDRARRLAVHPSYEFIEIYSDTLRAISPNGDVAVIKG